MAEEENIRTFLVSFRKMDLLEDPENIPDNSEANINNIATNQEENATGFAFEIEEIPANHSVYYENKDEEDNNTTTEEEDLFKNEITAIIEGIFSLKSKAEEISNNHAENNHFYYEPLPVDSELSDDEGAAAYVEEEPALIDENTFKEHAVSIKMFLLNFQKLFDNKAPVNMIIPIPDNKNEDVALAYFQNALNDISTVHASEASKFAAFEEENNMCLELDGNDTEKQNVMDDLMSMINTILVEFDNPNVDNKYLRLLFNRCVSTLLRNNIVTAEECIKIIRYQKEY